LSLLLMWKGEGLNLLRMVEKRRQRKNIKPLEEGPKRVINCGARKGRKKSTQERLEHTVSCRAAIKERKREGQRV